MDGMSTTRRILLSAALGLAAVGVAAPVASAAPPQPGGLGPEPTICIIKRHGNVQCFPLDLYVAFAEHCTPVGCDFGFGGSISP